MRRFLALAAACSLFAAPAFAETHEGDGAPAAPEYQLDVSFVCGSALDTQGHYATNLIAWLQARCSDGFIGADVCKEINHYVDAYSAQVEKAVSDCSARIEGGE